MHCGIGPMPHFYGDTLVQKWGVPSQSLCLMVDFGERSQFWQVFFANDIIRVGIAAEVRDQSFYGWRFTN